VHRVLGGRPLNMGYILGMGNFSPPDSPDRLWRRPPPIQRLPGPCVRDKGPGH